MAMTETFEIEDGVALEPSTAKYPFAKLDVGQSFFVPEKLTNQVSSAAYAWGLRNGKRLSCRKQGNGVRVFRTA